MSFVFLVEILAPYTKVIGQQHSHQMFSFLTFDPFSVKRCEKRPQTFFLPQTGLITDYIHTSGR